MKEYEFNCGVVVGRFSPLHIGHEKLINMALKKCKEVVVIVTSTDKLNENNPYSLKDRVYLINKVFLNDINEGRLKIATLIGEKNIDQSYGQQVLNIVKNVAKKQADYIIYGSDKNIEKCFSKEAIDKLHIDKMDRKYIDISATEIREALRCNDTAFLKRYLNPLVYEEHKILNNNI